mmetsp:Transcript_465/g.970  ORF Transcript_465/g.970 Transcript_465/m.970 type:complete len:86 (-) Transcript_465:336-593(-)
MPATHPPLQQPRPRFLEFTDESFLQHIPPSRYLPKYNNLTSLSHRQGPVVVFAALHPLVVKWLFKGGSGEWLAPHWPLVTRTRRI